MTLQTNGISVHGASRARHAAHVVREPRMRSLFDLIAKLAPSRLPILLLGETGCGKEVIADWVHRTSELSARPLLKINCAGLSESVVESELFGHERGAFTGAVQTHRGLFEVADGGSLFLDELAELPLRTQAKLLRVLETGEFCRLGSTQVRHASVRFIAATHGCLPQLIERGDFRRDLYFRLGGAIFEIPPLRERHLEIVPLAEHFLGRVAERLGHPLTLHAGARQALLEYAWPGNVRELRNAVECAAALCGDNPVIQADLLALGRPLCAPSRPAPAPLEPPAAAAQPALERDATDKLALRLELRSFERSQILSALQQSQGNQTRAAVLLGISRRTLTNKLNLHSIDRPRKLMAAARAAKLLPTLDPCSDFETNGTL